MDTEKIKSHFEAMAEESGLELTKKKLNSLMQLTREMADEDGISQEEMYSEFEEGFPVHKDDEEEWADYLEEAVDYVYDIITEDSDSEED